MKTYSFLEFMQDYPNDDVCLERLLYERYGGDTFTCKGCGVIDSKFYKLKGRRVYSCVNCRYQVHPTAGTIFHKSETSLVKWMYALYLFSVSKNGVSAMELQRHLKVTYKCAYRIGKKIRELMQQNEDKLSGIIEADETYIGGTRKRWQEKGVFANKTAVVGMTERKGKAKATVGFADATTATPMINTYAEKGSIIHTDESRIYTRVKRNFEHKYVNHSQKQYVRGDVHTNSIEGFWGQMKRSIDGTYHSVSAQQLQTYVNQFVFFYNHRGEQTFPILLKLAAQQGARVNQT
jgi:transposase